MAVTYTDAADRTNEIIESVRTTAEPALEAVRKFIDNVNGVFPDLSEDGPRRKIIDSAFHMAEQLVSLSTGFAEKVVNATRYSPPKVSA